MAAGSRPRRADLHHRPLATPDDRGDTDGTGHYDTLLSLVPGAKRVQLGTPHGAVICPWDVPELDSVPDQKIEFLLALHALLIGDAHDPEGTDPHASTPTRRRSSATRSPPSTRSCATTGERPREQLLIDALTARRRGRELEGTNADKLQSVLLRLGPYGQDGTLAHIADRQTTVPRRRTDRAV